MAFLKKIEFPKTDLILVCIFGIAGISLIVCGIINLFSTEFHQKKEHRDLTVQSQILKDEIKYMLNASLEKQNYLQQLSEELDSVSRRSHSVKYLLDNNKKENEKIQQALAAARQELFEDKGYEIKGRSGKENAPLPHDQKNKLDYFNDSDSLSSGYKDLKNRIESIREDLDATKQVLASRTMGDPAFKDDLIKQQQQLEKNYALVNKLHEQISNMVLTQQAMEEFSRMMNELEMSARDYKTSMHKGK